MIKIRRNICETGCQDVDKFIARYLDGLGMDISDEAIFMQSSKDTEDLTYVGLRGRLYQQHPEFVRQVVLDNCVLYHAFILYNNENGLHTFSIKGTLDEAAEQFLAEEVCIDD